MTYLNFNENEKRENQINKNGCFVSLQLQLNRQDHHTKTISEKLQIKRTANCN